jgi:hypothetical protein
MKMNWGTKLVIGMGLFMAFIITLAVLMMRSGSDDLVDQDYYQKGIEYDKDYVRKNQMQKDQAEPEISIGDSLRIVFKKPATGSIRFLHPSDKKNDRSVNLNSGTANEIVLPLTDISKGHWKLTLEWKSEEKEYMFEKNITIE